MASNGDDPATYLLLRDAVEVTLMVDAETARDLPDDVLIESLGKAALGMVRDHLAEHDEGDDE